MSESNNRVKIDFQVNSQELKEITQAINILDKFNKRASEVIQAVGKMGNSFENAGKKTKAAKNEYVNLDQAMNSWNSRLKANQSLMNSQEASQAKLTEKLRQYGRDVKVSVDETGKLSASFKNAEGNMVSMTGKYDLATNSIKNMKTTLSTVALEVKAKAEADKKAAQEMDRLHQAALKLNRGLDEQKKKYQELIRGTDISRVIRANGGAFDVMNNAVKTNATVVSASIDRNGKFRQSLRMQDGTLRSITGYYDQANKKLVQYSDSISRSEGSTKRVTTASQRFARQLTTLERSMQGLNKYTLTWAEAIEIAGTRMLQWNVAGTVIFGLQRLFRNLLSTLIEIDSQMTQLVRVLPDTTDFNELMNDSIRLSGEFGRTLTDINEALITFARSGFGNVDIRFLSEAATLMANVSDIDMFDASETLTSALTLFNIEARDAIQVVNKLNEVDNDYAISTTQLAKSITRAGGTAASFGVDLNELLGHTTAIGVATRESGQIIGNSLKTIYSRINTLPKAEAAIKSLGISMTLPNGDNRDVARIMDDIAAAWPYLNNAKKQSAAMDIAGTYQLSRFLAMMNNYEMGLNATETAQHSYNSAVNENSKFMNSAQAKINLLISAAQQLALALGKAGLYKAIHFVLESLTTFTKGITEVVKTFGAFSFAIPVAAAALGIFVAQFQKTRLELIAFQATMLGMNTSLSRQAFAMTATATTSTVLSGAFATLRTAALGLTAALLTNPLTWIAVALVAIPMLIGHFKRLKAEQEALHKKAEDNTKAFKDFKAEVKAGDVNKTSLDVYTAKIDVAEKALKDLKTASEKTKDAQEKADEAMKGFNNSYDNGGVAIKAHIDWQDKLSKKTKEELADIGIKYDKYKNIDGLMAAVRKRQIEYSDSVKIGNKVLAEAEEQLMFNADAFDEVGESVKETMDIMQVFFGVNDQMVQELIGSYNAIMVLSGLKEKDAAQTEVLEQAYAVWETRLGLSREELMKNPKAMVENIKWQEAMAEKWGEATGEILTAEQQKQLAIDITKQKTKEGANEQIAAEKYAAEEKIRIATEAAEAEAKAKEEMLKKIQNALAINQAIGLHYTEEEIKNAVSRSESGDKSAEEIIAALSKEKVEYGNTTIAYENLAGIQNQANKKRIADQSRTVEEIKADLDREKKKALDTGTGWSGMAVTMGTANTDAATSTRKSADNNIKALDDTKKKADDFKTTWEKLIAILKNPIKAMASFTIKGIIDWFGGKGGGTDPLQDLAGNSKGAGYSGMRMTSGFGMRSDPFTGAKSMHHGVDFAGPMGSAIRSNTGGQVIYSGFGRSGTGYGGLGNVVAIQDSSGLSHLYAHNSANYVSAGSFVKAGQTIAALGSTGNSTGPHSHYEVRAGSKAINPMQFLGGGTDPLKKLSKFHSGGIVTGGGYQPPSKTRRNNEVDVRVLKGEMVLTKQQQSQLYDMAGLGVPKHKYHTGGVVGGSSWKNAGSLSGMGAGDSYTIQRGDTLGGIAAKFNTTIKNLMALNSQIKDANKIYAGDVLKISQALQSVANNQANQIKSLYTTDQSAYSDSVAAINNKLGLGIYTNSSEQIWDLQNVSRARALTDDEKRSYNKDIFDAFSGLDNIKQFEAWFNNSKLFMTADEIAKVRTELTKIVKVNAMQKLEESTNSWLETFKNGLTNANEKVSEWLSLTNGIKEQLESMKQNAYIEKSVSAGMLKFGFSKEGTPEEELQKRMDTIRKEAEERLNQNAQLAYANDPEQLKKRLAELDNSAKQINDRIAAVTQTAISQGLSAADQTKLLAPLKEALAALNDEYKLINTSSSDATTITNGNSAAVEALSKEYAALQAQLDAATKEKMDEFGNMVRNLSGDNVTGAMIQAVNQAAAMAEAARVATESADMMNGTSASQVVIREVDSRPDIMPTSNDVSKAASDKEPKVYDAGVVTKNVTYIINTGVAIGSQSELREFAMMLKSMMDEEEGRGES